MGWRPVSPRGSLGGWQGGVMPGMGRGLARLRGYASPSLSSGSLLSGGWSRDEPTWWVQLKLPPGGSLDPCPHHPADASTRAGLGPLSIISLSSDTPLSAGLHGPKHRAPEAGPAEEGQLRWKGVGEGRQWRGLASPCAPAQGPHQQPQHEGTWPGAWGNGGGRGPSMHAADLQSCTSPSRLGLVCLSFRQHLGKDYERE